MLPGIVRLAIETLQGGFVAGCALSSYLMDSVIWDTISFARLIASYSCFFVGLSGRVIVYDRIIIAIQSVMNSIIFFCLFSGNFRICLINMISFSDNKNDGSFFFLEGLATITSINPLMPTP